MVHSIKDRLKQIAKDKGLSIRSFEEECGLGRGNISNMSPNGAIGSDKLTKIIDTFPDVDLYWLVTGDPEGLRGWGRLLRKQGFLDGDSSDDECADDRTPQNKLLLDKLLEQAEEIGRLKARIEELERRREDNAGRAQNSDIAGVG